MVSTPLRVKTSVSTEKAPEMSDASTQKELLRKETSVQMVGCNECPDPSPGEKVSTCKRCAQADDLCVKWPSFREQLKGCVVLEGLKQK